MAKEPAGTDTTGAIVSGGLQRTYRIYQPAGYGGGRPTPVVFVLHGGGGTAERVQRGTRFDRRADADGFLAVYPNGTGPEGGPQNWNDGRPGLHPARHGVDDVRFVVDLLDALTASHGVDRSRVYVAGISNGGMMAYRLGCELSDRTAAIAAVATTMTFAGCAPARPLPVVHIHGSADRFVPFAGGTGITRTPDFVLRSVPETLAFWRRANGCTAEPVVTVDESHGDRVTKTVYGGCAGGTEVVLYLIEGGSHSWPGSLAAAGPGGPPSAALDATAVICDFFRSYRLPS